MLRRIVFILFLMPLWSLAQMPRTVGDHGLVEWMTMDEAQDAYAKQAKPILVDLYTDWCGWCKHMIRTTYSNVAVAQYINANFYPVKFNAETRDTVIWQGDTLVNNGIGRRPTHELAVLLCRGRMSYPTTVFINDDYKFILPVPGYKSPTDLEPFLVYALENVFKTTHPNAFVANYANTYIDSANVSGKLQWVSIDEANAMREKAPRKTIIFFSADWCNSGRVMRNNTFNQPAIAQYLNETFYLVDFNTQSMDTVDYMGQRFYNLGLENGYFHGFARAAMNNSIVLPTLIFMNEEGAVINRMNYYLTPEDLEPIVHYFGDDAYKEQKWVDFQKAFVGTIK